MKTNEEGEEIEEHHTHYKEIDGYDETVFMTRSEHKKLHMRLRKEGKCNIPSKELHRISHNARSRTEKHQEWLKEWRLKNPDYHKKYNKERYEKNKEREKARVKKYYDENKEEINTRRREQRLEKKSGISPSR